jgi:hypothetical protein
MFRVLKPGGIIVMSTPNRRSWYGFDRYVVWRQILRKTWNHPYDNWRTLNEVTALLTRHGFSITSAATACYVPGFLLTYRLPRPAQALVASLVEKTERIAARLARTRGYTVVVTADKSRSADQER